MNNYHDPIRQSLSQDSVKMPEGQWPLIPDVAGLTKYINEQLKDLQLKVHIDTQRYREVKSVECELYIRTSY